MSKHQAFMAEAINLSKANLKTGKGGPFGAIVVKDGYIVARGWNQVTSLNDPTAHAEVVAIRNACKEIEDFSLKGCTIYTSCEPCPMCLSAIYWARIDKIYYANTRQDAAEIGFDDDFIYMEIPKAIEQRNIPMEQMMRTEANEIFTEWTLKEDKIEY